MVGKQILSYVFVLCSFTTSALASETVVEYLAPATNVQKVVVNNYDGDIVITPTQDDQVHVVATRQHRICHVRAELVNNVLTVHAGGFLAFGACDVKLALAVPQHVDLDVINGTGNLTVSGVQGNVVFNVSTGDVILDGQVGTLEAYLGHGQLTATTPHRACVGGHCHGAVRPHLRCTANERWHHHQAGSRAQRQPLDASRRAHSG